MQIGSQRYDLPAGLPSASNPLQADSAPPPDGFQNLLQQDAAGPSDDLKEAFQSFVGQTFFGEMIKAFRSTQQPSAYFHGGRAEEIFQGQFDQAMTEELSQSSSEKIADPMFELFMLKRAS